jgi:predicted transcriptional regulator
MDCIQRIYRATDGGSYVVTDRGTNKVVEPLEQIEAYMANAVAGKAVNHE